MPLQLTGGAALQRAPAAKVPPGAPPTPPPAPTVANPTPTVAGNTPSAPQGPPVEVSQRMLDALDKYMNLEKQRGSTVDAVH